MPGVAPPVQNPLRFQRPQLPSADAIEGYLQSARDRRWFSNSGPCWELLRDRLSAATGASAVPVASGTAGLMVAIAALRRRGLSGARQALMPSFAFPATAQAAIWNGLEPVFVDVDSEHWHLDPGALSAALDGRAGEVAIVVALSSFGTPPPPPVRDAWEHACGAAGVPLLVDSAAGFGAVASDGRPIGAQGSAEVVSFHATKPLAAGEGGAVFTRDPDLAEEIERLGNFGLDDARRALDGRGLNTKLSEPAAAIALAAFDQLPAALTARRDAATQLLELAPALTPQAGHELGTWQFVPALAPSAAVRDALLAAAEGRVELRHYYDPLHSMPAFSNCVRASALDRTEENGRRMLSLPMAPDLTDAEIDLIGAVVADGFADATHPPAGRHAISGAAAGDSAEELSSRHVGVLARLGEVRSAQEAACWAAAAPYERQAGWPQRLAEIRASDAWADAYAEAQPLVTVRIATWNNARVLCERTLASVLAQDYERWEAIVVGDACTDDTAERIAALGDTRIRFHNRPLRGPYPSDPQQRWMVAGIPGMNLGAELARGSWIAPLDHDDEWEPHHLRVLVGAALRDHGELAYGRLRGRLEDPPLEVDIGTWPPRLGDFGFQGAIYNAALREFRYDPACRFLGEPGDWNLARRMWEAGVRFTFVDRVVTTWHNEEGSPELVGWFRERAARA